jgi:hypothetical protein
MLPAGEYYIGDLCYVIDDENWDNFCAMTCFGNHVLDGEFNFQGTAIACYGTMYGDGCYRDQTGHEYPVDAGLIGCILLSEITKPEGVEHGRVVTFERSFRTFSYRGVIGFDNVQIDTSDNEKDEY